MKFYEVFVLKDQKIVEEKGTTPVPTTFFLASLLYFFEKDIFCHVLITGASFASMTCTLDDHIGNKQCTCVLLAVIRELQVYSYSGRKRDNKLSLRNDRYFQNSAVNAGADAIVKKGAGGRRQLKFADFGDYDLLIVLTEPTCVS